MKINSLVLLMLGCLMALFVLNAPVYALDGRNDFLPVSTVQPLDPNAQHRLAVKYANGDGVPVDMQKAAYWFARAAEQGHARAQHNMGVMYARGDGVAQLPGKAASWFQKAAEQGHSGAQRELALLHAKGEGIPKDLERSYFWILLAGVNGDRDLLRVRNAVESQLTAQQRVRAQTDARNWRPRT